MSHLSPTLIILLGLALTGGSFPIRAAGEASAPPWKGEYKIAATDKARLTAADVVGPDGIVYPNWTRCGVQGGISIVAAAARIEEFGGRLDDGQDDSAALDRACETVGKNGGGAVLLGEGTYHLDRPVTIRDDGVIIRGLGPEKTRIIFRYALPAGGVAFFGLEPGERIGKATPIVLHCRPAGLEAMEIEADGRVVSRWERSKHSGNTFVSSTSGRVIARQLADGPHVLRGIAHYKDGTSLQGEIPVVLDSSYQGGRRVADWRAAILFAGRGQVGPKLKLARDGRRGDEALVLASVAGLSAADRVYIEAPATDRWKALVRDACAWGRYRAGEYQIDRIEANTVVLSQPLRIDFPVVDGSFVCKTLPIQRCGVEDLYLEQTEDLWITGVGFDHAWNCWARGVTIKKCGRFPVYGSNAKWCEIRDCVFDDAWFKGGGGTAYAGWDGCWDCLMEHVETFKLRHSPLFQWAASGNVIRKSVFHDSDAQWHSGWTHENLIEDCVVESAKGNGGYGYGMWASPPEDTAHGPNGPRNVVYNCDIRSSKTGLWMGGMNENWLILFNRFVVAEGFGVFAKTASFDHIIRGNVFVLKDAKSSMVRLETADCIGVELVDNTLVGGSGEFVSGLGKPGREEGNRVLKSGAPARPAPAVRSIYEWQRQHVAGGSR